MIKIVKELLDSGAIKQESADKLSSEWAAHTKKLNDENKILREEKENLSKNYDEVLKSKGELDSQLADLDDKIKKAKEEGKGELAKELEKERMAKDTLQTSLSNLEAANHTLTIESGIQKAMSAFDDKNPLDNARLIGLDTTLVDGKLMYKSGDSVVTLENGVKTFYESRQDTIRAQGNPGSGAGGNGGTGGAVNTKDMTPSQMMANKDKRWQQLYWKRQSLRQVMFISKV